MQSPNQNAGSGSEEESVLSRQYWRPHPDLDKALIPVLQRYVNSIPVHEQRPPLPNEEYETPEAAFDRVQNAAFCQGFLVVRGSGSEKAGRIRINCVHSGKQRNTRKIEEGERKRATKTLKQNCPYACYVSFRKVPDGSGRKAWVLGITHNNHNHDMEPNPLTYHKHLERHPDFIRVQAEAREQREAGVSYNATLHENDQERGDALVLDRKTYYNTARHKRERKMLEATASGDDSILKEILQYLEQAKFIIRTRLSSNPNVGNDGPSAPSSSLEQIFFCTPTMISMARRFVSGFIMQPDASFAMRIANIPLHCCVGMTNTNTTFPCCFSFTRTENKAAFDFLFHCLRDLFWNNCPPPEVILAYPSTDITASLSECAADSIIQLPEWTMQKNVKSKLTPARGYTAEAKQDISELLSRYIKWPHPEDLNAARDAFLSRLSEADREFVQFNWIPREKTLLLCYTTKLRNLACYSTQRNASYHSAMKEWINPDWDLDESMKNFVRYIQDLPLKTAHDQISSRMKTRIGLDRHAFKHLIHKTTIFALDAVDKEWQKAVKTVRTTPEHGLNPPDIRALGVTDIPMAEFSMAFPPKCNCTIPYQFALPCQHYLIPVVRANGHIPLSIIHPRWLLEGPAIVQGRWEIGMVWIPQSALSLVAVTPSFSTANSEEALLEKQQYTGQQGPFDAPLRVEPLQHPSERLIVGIGEGSAREGGMVGAVAVRRDTTGDTTEEENEGNEDKDGDGMEDIEVDMEDYDRGGYEAREAELEDSGGHNSGDEKREYPEIIVIDDDDDDGDDEREEEEEEEEASEEGGEAGADEKSEEYALEASEDAEQDGNHESEIQQTIFVRPVGRPMKRKREDSGNVVTAAGGNHRHVPPAPSPSSSSNKPSRWSGDTRTVYGGQSHGRWTRVVSAPLFKKASQPKY